MTEQSAKGRVLLVDDEVSMCSMLHDGLGRRGFTTTYRTSAEEAFDLLTQEEFAVVVTDLNLRSGWSGLELCSRVVASRPDIPVILVTAFGNMETAIEAIRAGAYDFVTKPVDIDALAVSLHRALQHRALRVEVRRLRQQLSASRRFDRLIGESPPMQRLYDLLDRLADADATVLVTGESGSGKELVAAALHARGPRKAGPFVAINCAAVPETLLESELFGHVRGAFTDARAARQGLFHEAHRGTLFLDEVADLPIGLQPKLLRALQERRARPIGGDRELEFDIRLVAATNRDLETAIEQGRFREDLYFRINVVPVHVPPLRARGADVLLLAQHFLEHNAARSGKPVLRLSSAVGERLLAYSWPGNVRELQNVIERAVALTRFDELTVEDLPESIRNAQRARAPLVDEDPGELVSMEEIERRYILRVLEAAGGNRTVAAKILGFDRKTLYRKLERIGAE